MKDKGQEAYRVYILYRLKKKAQITNMVKIYLLYIYDDNLDVLRWKVRDNSEFLPKCPYLSDRISRKTPSSRYSYSQKENDFITI